MSTIRTAATSLAAAVALAGGITLASAPSASASVTCMPVTPNVNCSIYWANRTNLTAIYNTRNTAVTALQRSLTQAKFPVGTTGHYNSYTVKAVKSYQYSRKLTVTGTLNSSTLHALRVGAGAKISTLAVASTSRATTAVTFAYAQIGKPYVYGATGPSSYDCSGLTGASWKAAGVSLPRTSYQQLSSLPTVSKSNLRPGDLVGFYSGSHIAVYVGNGYVVHASRAGQPVSKVPMSWMPYYKAVRPAA